MGTTWDNLSDAIPADTIQVKKQNRDDFKAFARLVLAKRAGWLCSFPTCRKPTVGATQDDDHAIDIGTAAHICAAAPGGPRYDATQTPEARSSVKNGIWMCRDHGKAIDSPDSEFTVAQLHEWKKQAESESRWRVLHNEPISGPAAPKAVQSDAPIRSAAQADLDVFRKTQKWPTTSVPLALKVDGFDGPVTTEVLARASVALDDLILVAPPGMGKTTTLFQVADGLLRSGAGIPLVVLLGDWATGEATILDSILRRPAFRDLTEDDFRASAARPGVVLLLDGWNELDTASRKRARVQVDLLKAELPELGLVVSSRKQAFDVPFDGMRIELQPLDEDQQLAMATALRGDAGAAVLDRAWRTKGVRELVTIPLYLATLLALPDDAPFPTTKEEVLRRFVASHERDPDHAEALHAATQGFHREYLEELATCAMRAANTTISDNNARQCIVGTANVLADDWKISNKPQPDDVLAALVSNHLLLRSNDATGYAFQHQQFQEWYAAGELERRIFTGTETPADREALKAEIFDQPAWEEVILFAAERLARGNERQQAACGEAIRATLEVDPDLAAEMIYRCTDQVWARIEPTIVELVARWHAPGKIDRALRFMLASSRVEFFDAVWPLITADADQISMEAVRQCERFRASIFGQDAADKLRKLPTHTRAVLVAEMAWHGDADSLALASTVARADPDPEIQARVVEAFALRRADHHLTAVLRDASEKTLELVAAKLLPDEITDKQVRQAVLRARERSAPVAKLTSDRLHAIILGDVGDARDEELTEIIATLRIDGPQDASIDLIHTAWTRRPAAVAEGLLARLHAGSALFPGADDMLAASGTILDDDNLLELALTDPAARDARTYAAASVLGPRSAGHLVDAFLNLDSRRDADGQQASDGRDAAFSLRTRIAHVPASSLVAAVQERSTAANSKRLAQLAEILTRSNDGVQERSRPFDAQVRTTIHHLIAEWASRMLMAGDASRLEKAALAQLAKSVPDETLLPILKQLLDDELERYRAFRIEAQAHDWKRGPAVNEARTLYTGHYYRAFEAIRSPLTARMMEPYLADAQFGELAAQVLAEHWRLENEAPARRYTWGGIDFSVVKDKRQARALEPDRSSAEADKIFAAAERLMEGDPTDEQKHLAVALGAIASRLPHGRRDDIIRKLVPFASRRKRPDLLLNLVLSGDHIDLADVAGGISDTVEAAKSNPWILMQSDGYELKQWLRLLPFVDQVMETLRILRSMPPTQMEPRFLANIIDLFPHSPASDAEDALFSLAEEDPRFYSDYHWRHAALHFGTPSSAHQIMDLVARGVLSHKRADWDTTQALAHLIATSAGVRTHVYGLLETRPATAGHALLARAVGETPDEDGILLLVQLEMELNISYIGERSIQKAVTEDVPIEDWSNAYDVVPVAANSLRSRLLAITTDGGEGDVAARVLRVIDECRHRYGKPEAESRHPDLRSGKPWPILRPDPYAEGIGN
jgi:hypothetical protein